MDHGRPKRSDYHRHKEIPGSRVVPWTANEALPGPIYLQGSEKGHVAYRSIVITSVEK